MNMIGTAQTAGVASARILIVEDDIAVRDFCMRSLRIHGYQVATAENGRVALDRLRESHYDVIITDLQMPEMGGITLLKELRSLGVDTSSDTIVIVFTAYGTFETAREALRLGASDYLTKPVGLDDLERTVRRSVEWLRVRQEKQRLSEIVALYELSQTFTSTLDTDTAVREIVRLLWRRFSPRMLSLSLFHPEHRELELLAQRGTTGHLTLGLRVPVRGRDEQAISDAHQSLVGSEHAPSPNHTIGGLLRAGDQPVGVLRLTRGADQPGFGEDDRTMFAVCASQIAASLDNSRLYRQQKDQTFQIVKALTAAIDARDPYTLGHSEQVMRYAVRMAEVVGMGPQQIEAIRYGALLHDIGKIGIRDYILLKPGPLDGEEIAFMQQHPKIGADILRNIVALRDIIPIIECHHERIDGQGYPAGVSGEKLNAEARILAITDAYDAMTSDRAYRKAMARERAFEILMGGRGSHWDGTLVEVFVDLISREGDQLLLPQARPPQLSVDGLLGRPMLAPADARD